MDIERGLRGSVWAAVLKEGLGASAVLTCPPGMRPVNWSVFARLGMKAAYPNFPVGFEEEFIDARDRIGDHLKQLRRRGVDLAMFSFPRAAAFDLPIHAEVARQPETRILGLSAWSEARMSSATRRKVSRAERHGLVVRPCSSEDGECIHKLYVESVRRKGGGLRYGVRYFQALCEASSRSSAVSVGIVRREPGDIVGFISLLHGPEISYYLHGGYAIEAATFRPGYLAMYWAIRRCCALGCETLNLLTSPADQPGLVAFKESFGGLTQERIHYRVPLGFFGNCADLSLRTLRGLGI